LSQPAKAKLVHTGHCPAFKSTLGDPAS